MYRFVCRWNFMKTVNWKKNLKRWWWFYHFNHKYCLCFVWQSQNYDVFSILQYGNFHICCWINDVWQQNDISYVSHLDYRLVPKVRHQLNFIFIFKHTLKSQLLLHLLCDLISQYRVLACFSMTRPHFTRYCAYHKYKIFKRACVAVIHLQYFHTISYQCGPSYSLPSPSSSSHSSESLLMLSIQLFHGICIFLPSNLPSIMKPLFLVISIFTLIFNTLTC